MAPRRRITPASAGSAGFSWACGRRCLGVFSVAHDARPWTVACAWSTWALRRSGVWAPMTLVERLFRDDRPGLLARSRSSPQTFADFYNAMSPAVMRYFARETRDPQRAFD